jgi:hypothetical protein
MHATAALRDRRIIRWTNATKPNLFPLTLAPPRRSWPLVSSRRAKQRTPSPRSPAQPSIPPSPLCWRTAGSRFTLAAQHAHLADHSDLNLLGDTRWAARWRLTGAALAYANALVDLSDRGYVDPALPISRALYEALGVLGVVNDDTEQTILDRWLEDREVQPKKVRAAAVRQAERIAEEAAERGIELDVIDVSEQMEQIYRVLSNVSHVRRSGLRGMVSVPLRRAIYGAHPDPLARAHGVASTVLAVEATIIGVGDPLAAFYGGPYYPQIIKPIQDGLTQSAAQLTARLNRP